MAVPIRGFSASGVFHTLLSSLSQFFIKKAPPMNRSPSVRASSIATLLLISMAQICHGGDWPKLLDHTPAGANTIALFNAEALRFGASKLKQFKEGEQQPAAADLVAELPENSKRAAISANIDFDSLETIWETATVTFDKNIPTPKALAEQQGGYIDQISGKPVVWSSRGRYIVPLGADRVAVHIPANRKA